MNIAPLSFQQQWLWDLSQQHAGWSSVLGYAYRLSGNLSVADLRIALGAITDRHDSLRTIIVTDDGIVWQRIMDPGPVQLEVVDVEDPTTHPGSAPLQRLLEEFCEQDIDPGVPPLLRLRLFRESGHEHVLAIAVHRIVADCFSIDQLLHELWCEYARCVNQLTEPAAAPPTQYRHYATLQHQKNGQWLQKHGGYWQQRLSGTVRLNWPYDPGASSITPGTVGRMKRFFGGELSAALQEVARKARTLAANVMLAVYAAVLSKWCNQSDLLIPFNIAGRQSEHKLVVGYFSHIVLLRIQLAGNETFTDLLRMVSSAFFHALSHQDYGRMATDHPELLAGTYFQWASWHTEDPATSAQGRLPAPFELTTERLHVREFGEGTTAIPPGMVDVEMTFFYTDEGIHARGVYRADRFEAETMERFLADLQLTAERFVSDPQSRAILT